MAVITRTFPAESRGPGDEPVGRDRGRRDAGRADPGRRARRRARLGVDLLHQRAGRRPRARAGRPAGPRAAHQRAPLRLLGVVLLSAVGMFLLVFGIQEGQTYDWGTIAGPISVWSLIIAGIVVLAVFVLLAGPQQGRAAAVAGAVPRPQLQPGRVAIATVGFGVTAIAFPLMLLRAGRARAVSPTQSALLLVPMAVVSGGAVAVRRQAHRPGAPALGRRVRAALLRGRAGLARPRSWPPRAPIWELLLPIALLGRGQRVRLGAAVHLGHPQPADGATPAPAPGVYNTTRQIGAVLGSAGIAVLMQARLAADAARRGGWRHREPACAAAGGAARGLQHGDGAVAGAARRGAARGPGRGAGLRRGRGTSPRQARRRTRALGGLTDPHVVLAGARRRPAPGHRAGPRQDQPASRGGRAARRTASTTWSPCSTPSACSTRSRWPRAADARHRGARRGRRRGARRRDATWPGGRCSCSPSTPTATPTSRSCSARASRSPAGMAGGSADAAAALVGLSALWKLDLVPRRARRAGRRARQRRRRSRCTAAPRVGTGPRRADRARCSPATPSTG